MSDPGAGSTLIPVRAAYSVAHDGPSVYLMVYKAGVPIYEPVGQIAVVVISNDMVVVRLAGEVVNVKVNEPAVPVMDSPEKVATLFVVVTVVVPLSVPVPEVIATVTVMPASTRTFS